MAWKPLILPRPEHQDPAHITKEVISSLVNAVKLKNREAKKEPSREPYAQNPIYQKQ